MCVLTTESGQKLRGLRARVPLSLTDAEARTTTYSYDVRDRRIGITDPLSKSWSYSYNTMDDVESSTDPLGRLNTPMNRV